MEGSDGKEEEGGDLQEESKKEIMKLSRDEYPAQTKESRKAYEKIVNQIIETYNLTNPVDQMIANRAATQLMLLQHCQSMLDKYGLFYVRKTNQGDRIEMNQLSYFMKQLESEFRSNIRMLKGKEVPAAKGPDNFSDWLEVKKDGKAKR